MNHSYCQTAMGWTTENDFSGLYAGTSMPAGSLVGYMESHDEERTGFKALEMGKYRSNSINYEYKYWNEPCNRK